MTVTYQIYERVTTIYDDLTSHILLGQVNISDMSLSSITYRQTSNISRTQVGNKIVDHSDVVEASPVGAAPTTSSFSTWTAGFNGLDKDNSETVRETFKCSDLVRLILEIREPSFTWFNF